MRLRGPLVLRFRVVEAVQDLTQAVLQASGGQLRDDATALCLDWHGGPPRDREATSGANREGRLDQAAST